MSDDVAMWTTLAATGVGAVIALIGAVLNDELRSRRDRAHQQSQTTNDAYIGFMVALQRAHDMLKRPMADQSEGSMRATDVNRSLTDSGACAEREKLLIAAPPAVILAAEEAFQSVVSVRDELQRNPLSDWNESHMSWASFADKIWSLRQAVRKQAGNSTMDLEIVRKLESLDNSE